MADEPIQYGRVKIPQGFPKEEDYNPPPAPSPYFDLWLLPDPPDDACVCFNRAWTAFENERALSRGVLGTLAKHHFWGIDWHRSDKMKKSVILKGLWKLFYHMPERNRPHTLGELVDLDRDAGPRLLGYEPRKADPQNLQNASSHGLGSHSDDGTKTARELSTRTIVPPQPVSIQHHRMPPVMQDGASYDPPFDMPEDAKRLNLRPSHVRQYLFPLYKIMLPKEPWTPLGPGDAPEIKREAPPRREVLMLRRQQASEINESEIPRLSDGNPPSSDYPPLPRPKYATEKKVNEAIVETLMKLTYHEIQRHDTAPARGMAPYFIAEKPTDFDIIQVCMGPRVFEVSIDLNSLEISPLGKVCQYQGRGPVGSVATASIDTVIVMGMLTEAGCTAIDRFRGRHELFDDVEMAYIEVTNMNWDCMDAELSAELRDSFFRKLHANYPSFAMGQTIPPWAVWAKLTRNFAQFQYTFQDRSHYCACEGKTCEDSPVTIGNCLLPPFRREDRDGVTPGALVGRKLGVEHKWGCEICSLTRGEGRITERTITRLPPRLSLLTNSETRLVDHTADFTFSYRDANGVIEEARYRWLGGIYHRDGRLRVYWSDGEPGRTDPMTIRGYDPLSKEDDWLQSTIPLLIYERVIDPPKPSLLFWGAHITHMLKNINEKRPALHGHTLPTRPRYLAKPMHKDRRLPSLGDRSFEIHRPDPGTQLELNPFIGNSESNLYSLMKVNPFHSVVPSLFQAVAKNPLPELPPGVAPELPAYPLPDPVHTFDSLLSSPDIYLQNPQTWSLGPMEVRERRVDPEDVEDWEGLEDWLEHDELPPVPMEPLVPPLPPLSQERGGNGNDTQIDRRAESQQAESETKAKEQQMAQEMWMQWINFSPSQSQKSSADSNKSGKSERSNDNDTHMGGTSVGPRSERRRAGTGTGVGVGVVVGAGAGAGVEQRGTKHRGKNR
ncbi:hypothetical protein N7481_010052 [Penicillium waksmanii]|uniref:uncharacterized protein n=1 Tax=Penicillium waksmanii TaxID=69791 RepID=UPI002547410B|nr:uncharacterized protein N7481_010052 [Penicillium waksmanii]KAJ5976345.1 hypothetical protein N7481_010052 [Penicillium waksmanii]